jgi:perosamine synthetase
MDVPSTKPYFSEIDINAISDEVRSILRSGRLILGPYTTKFEEAFREYCGVKHAVAVSSCTAALEIVMRYFDVAGKEVIIPTNTFLATSNAVIYSGGTVVLCDIKADTLCLDPAEVLKLVTPRTRGVIVVHLGGMPYPDIEELRETCRDRGLFLVEDVAHAHGASIGGKKTGSLADAGCFSFYPTKVMTTGTGGIITTDNDKLAEFAISLRHHGVGTGLHHIINLGNDWLMSEISALLGIYQLKALEANLTRRNQIAQKYADALANVNGIEVLRIPSHIRHAYYKFPVFLSADSDTNKFVEIMQKEYKVNIGSIYDPPCHLQPIYQKLFGYSKGMFPVADRVLVRTRSLPIFSQMTDEETEYVLHCLQEVLPVCRMNQMTVGKVFGTALGT